MGATSSPRAGGPGEVEVGSLVGRAPIGVRLSRSWRWHLHGSWKSPGLQSRATADLQDRDRWRGWPGLPEGKSRLGWGRKESTAKGASCLPTWDGGERNQAPDGAASEPNAHW